jgi:phosphomannomutase
MTLIKSISGIRGTIGGKTGDNLTPLDVVKFTSAFAQWIKNTTKKEKLTIVIGRDARLSGEMVSNLVSGTLIGMGVNVIDLGLSTTPTVEIAVPFEKADGGIIITASHNPKQWNALKLLNHKGEFISGEEGETLLNIAENGEYYFSEVDNLGNYSKNDTYLDKHVNEVLNLALVDVDAIKKANFKVVVDAVNSTGGIFIPYLLEKIGVEVVKLYCEPTGNFPHNPEPLKENLTDIAELVVKEKAHFGIVVDPDVDRLAFVSENGEMFGEEYTLVAVADYVLKHTKGNTVSNLSSTRALNDITKKNGGEYFASAVGEVNVVEKMKAVNAVIGGEGNGGIIYPELHYGRDALVGVGLFLSHLAHENTSCSALRNSYPNYEMSKNKIQLTPQINVDEILVELKEVYKNERVNDIDGVKIDFEKEWVHLRKSNTEPIIRVYSESETLEGANKIAQTIIDKVNEIVNVS